MITEKRIPFDLQLFADGGAGDGGAGDGGADDDKDFSPAALAKLKETREEAKKHREEKEATAKERDDLKKKLAEREAADKQREKDELAEKKTVDEQLESLKTELSTRDRRALMAEVKAAALEVGLIDKKYVQYLDVTGLSLDANGDLVGADGEMFEQRVEKWKKSDAIFFSDKSKDDADDNADDRQRDVRGRSQREQQRPNPNDRNARGNDAAKLKDDEFGDLERRLRAGRA